MVEFRCNISQSGLLARCGRRLHVGGNWDNRSSCGSRSVNGNELSSNRNGNNGARLVSDTGGMETNPELFLRARNVKALSRSGDVGAKIPKAEYCTLLSAKAVAKHTTGNSMWLVNGELNATYYVKG